MHQTTKDHGEAHCQLDMQKKLVAFDCDKESNFLPPSQYSLGAAVTYELERVQKVDLVEKQDVRLFRIACWQIICGIFDKIVERSPIKRYLCRYMSYLTPDNLHIKSADALEDKVKKIVMKISSLKIVTDTFADKINDQFGDFASALKQNTDLLDKCKLFDRKNER